MNNRIVRPWRSHKLLDYLTTERAAVAGTICYFALFIVSLEKLPLSFHCRFIPTVEVAERQDALAQKQQQRRREAWRTHKSDESQ